MDYEYEVLIYIGKNIITAIKVTDDKHEYISMKGESEHPADDVEGFYENLINDFSVEELSDLEVRVRIINGGASSETMQFLYSHLIKVKQFSLWNVEEILPIMALQKSLIERNSSVSIEMYSECYNVISDCYYNLSVEKVSKAEKEVTLDDFVFMDRINGSEFLDKGIKAHLLEIENRMLEDERKLNSLEEQYKRLNNIMDSMFYVLNPEAFNQEFIRIMIKEYKKRMEAAE